MACLAVEKGPDLVNNGRRDGCSRMNDKTRLVLSLEPLHRVRLVHSITTCQRRKNLRTLCLAKGPRD